MMSAVHALKPPIVLNSIDLDSIDCSQEDPHFTSTEFKLRDVSRTIIFPPTKAKIAAIGTRSPFIAPEVALG